MLLYMFDFSYAKHLLKVLLNILKEKLVIRKIFNLNYVVMACAILYNLCIARNDPCQYRWKLSVEQLELNAKDISRQQSNKESNENATKVANWLWENLA